MKSLDEFVMIIDDVLPDSIIAALMDEYIESVAWMTYEAGRGDAPDAASSILITHPKQTGHGTRREELGKEVAKYISKAFDQYHARFSRREQGLNFLMVDKLVGLRLIRYKVGQLLVNHTDKYPDSDSGLLSWPAVTCTISLNDDFSGGRLNLLDGEMCLNLKVGQGVFFPANFLYPHSVERVNEGARYSLVGWFM